MALWRMVMVVMVLTCVLGVSVFAADGIQAELLSVQQRVVGLPLSGMVASYFGDETVNLHINESASGDFVLGVASKESVISTFAVGELVDPDVDVYMSEATLTSLLSGVDMRNQLGLDLESGTITYTAHGFFNKIKYAIVVSRIKGQSVAVEDDSSNRSEVQK